MTDTSAISRRARLAESHTARSPAWHSTSFEVEQNLKTWPSNGARTIAFDSKTGHLFAMASEALAVLLLIALVLVPPRLSFKSKASR